MPHASHLLAIIRLVTIAALGVVPPSDGGLGEALDVLHAWDARRAAAYVAGDAARLRALYARPSTAGDRDVALLRWYAARGLHVASLATQVVSAGVARRSEDRLVVRIVDRAVGWVTDDVRCRPLPTSAPRHRTVALRRTAGTWVVVAVR